jgi:hypothetical protein
VLAQAGITVAVTGLGTAATEVHKQVKEKGWNSFDSKSTLRIAAKAVGTAAISFGCSVIASGAGKVVSNNVKNKGSEMLLQAQYQAKRLTKRQVQAKYV